MAFPLQVGQILQTTVFCQQGPQLGLSVFHHSVADVAGTPTDLDLANYWDSLVVGTGLATIVPALITNNATYLGVGVTIIRPVIQVTQYKSHSVGGTAGTAPMPFQVSGLVSKRTVLPGRHGRGRFYVPFPDEASSAIDAQGYPSPSSDYIASCGSYALAMVSPIVGATVGLGTVELVPVVYNRLDPINSVTITGYLVRPLWATQRRRSESGRPNVPPL